MKICNFACGLSMLALSACVTSDYGDKVPDKTPDLSSTEAGLWMQMDRFEKKLARSELVIQDEELISYLNDMLCDLASEHCNEVRIYVLNNISFNASMAPNGAMYVHTGLLLRAENEAQLATVIGHEFGHYYKRHSLKNFETARNATDFAALFGLALGAGGLGIAGSAVSLAAIGGIQSYSRDLEREADFIGQKLIVEAGYNPMEPVYLWKSIKEETELNKEAGKRSSALSTHPATDERIKNLTKWAATYVDAQDNYRQGEAFDEIVTSRWAGWVEELLDTRDLKQTLHILEGLEELGFALNDLNYFRGEIYRKRGNKEEGDLDTARDYYLLSVSSDTGEPVPAAYKKLGIIEKRTGAEDKAKSYFESYLKTAPDASDRIIIESYIKELS